MRRPCCQGFIAFLLKFLNFLQTFIGISIIIYSAYMLNHWQHHHDDDFLSPKPDAQFSNSGEGYELNKHSLPPPWFIYAFMGIGVILCCITCIGHIGAEAVNGCCLCFYSLLMTIFLLLEVSLVVFIALDRLWEKDLPMDPTGELHSLRTFIEQNMDVCKWIGITVIIIQPSDVVFSGIYSSIRMILSGICVFQLMSFRAGQEGKNGQIVEDELACCFLACALAIDLAFSLLLAIVLRALVSNHGINDDVEGDYDVIGRVREPLLDPRLSQTSGSTKSDVRIGHSDIWSSRMREKYHLEGESRHHVPNQNPS